MHVRYAFAFSATSLQASFTAPLFATFGLRHLIEGANVYETPTSNLSQVVEFFSSATYLPRHTALVFLARVGADGGAVHVHEVRWSHPRIRPFGRELPLQCVCGALRSFLVKNGRMTGEVIVKCRRDECNHTFVIKEKGGYQMTQAGEGGQWLHRIWPPQDGDWMEVDQV